MIVSANSSTSAGGLASAAIGMRPTRCGAEPRHRCEVLADELRRPVAAGPSRRPRSPVCSVAACTCAIDAAASGMRSNYAKTSSSGQPRSCLDDRAHDLSNVSAGTWSRQSLNSRDQLFGEQPLAGGDDLAELDVGRAEVNRRLRVAGARVRRAGVASPFRRSNSTHAADRPSEACGHPRRRAIPGAPGAARMSSGTSPRHAARTASSPASHVMSSGSSTHGGSSLNAPEREVSRHRSRRRSHRVAGSFTSCQSRSPASLARTGTTTLRQAPRAAKTLTSWGSDR